MGCIEDLGVPYRSLTYAQKPKVTAAFFPSVGHLGLGAPTSLRVPPEQALGKPALVQSNLIGSSSRGRERALPILSGVENQKPQVLSLRQGLCKSGFGDFPACFLLPSPRTSGNKTKQNKTRLRKKTRKGSFQGFLSVCLHSILFIFCHVCVLSLWCVYVHLWCVCMRVSARAWVPEVSIQRLPVTSLL